MKKRGVRTRAGKDFHPVKLSDVGGNEEGWNDIMEVRDFIFSIYFYERL